MHPITAPHGEIYPLPQHQIGQPLEVHAKVPYQTQNVPYPVQPNIFVQTIPQQPVIIRPINFDKRPMNLQCRFCHKQVQTSTSTETSNLGNL